MERKNIMFISRQINEDLSEQIWEKCFMEELPRIRFLKPKKLFWASLKDIKKSNNLLMFIDCGTGNGDIPKEASQDHNIKMGGCDIVKREGWRKNPCMVQIIPAHRMPMTPTIWPIVCRPDHSGWVRGLLEKALEENAGFIYTGLRKNMAQDLGEWMLKPHTKITDVGEDNEEMLIFLPIK